MNHQKKTPKLQKKKRRPRNGLRCARLCEDMTYNIYVHTCITSIRWCVFMYVYIYMSLHIYIDINMCICIHINMCIPLYAYIYIYIYTVYIHIEITYIHIYCTFYSNFVGQTLEPYGSLLSFFVFYNVEDCADFMVEPPNLDYVSNVWGTSPNMLVKIRNWPNKFVDIEHWTPSACRSIHHRIQEFDCAYLCISVHIHIYI